MSRSKVAGLALGAVALLGRGTWMAMEGDDQAGGGRAREGDAARRRQAFRGTGRLVLGEHSIAHVAAMGAVVPDWLERVSRGCVEDPALRREVAAGRGPAHPSG